MQSRRKLIFDKIKKSLSIVNIGVVSAIILPIAYLLGSSYHQGYLSVYGIEASVFPLSTQDVYIYSYQAVGRLLLTIPMVLKFPGNLGAFAISLASILVIYCYLSIQDENTSDLIKKIVFKTKELFSPSFWEENNFTKSIWITFIAFESAFSIIILLLLIPVLWWIVPLAGYSEGQKVALSTRGSFSENGCSAHQKTEVDTCSVIQDKDGNILHEGLLIAINDKDIAMFKKDGGYIFTLQKDWLIRRKLH